MSTELFSSETNLHLDVVVTREILLSKCESEGFESVHAKENTRGKQSCLSWSYFKVVIQAGGYKLVSRALLCVNSLTSFA